MKGIKGQKANQPPQMKGSKAKQASKTLIGHPPTAQNIDILRHWYNKEPLLPPNLEGDMGNTWKIRALGTPAFPGSLETTEHRFFSFFRPNCANSLTWSYPLPVVRSGPESFLSHVTGLLLFSSLSDSLVSIERFAVDFQSA